MSAAHLLSEREALLRRAVEGRPLPDGEPEDRPMRGALARGVRAHRRQQHLDRRVEREDRELVLVAHHLNHDHRGDARVLELLPRHRGRAVEGEHDAHPTLREREARSEAQREPGPPVGDGDGTELGEDRGIEEGHVSRTHTTAPD